MEAKKYSEQISLHVWFIRGTCDACYRPQYQTSDPSIVFNNTVHHSH